MKPEDLFRQMEEDERKDRIEVTGKASPIEYARLRNITPQRVYYYIRRRKLNAAPCGECGRLVVTVEEADRVLFPEPFEETIQAEEDATREDVQDRRRHPGRKGAAVQGVRQVEDVEGTGDKV